MSQGAIPKKIYRHVLKALQFYHVVDGSGCTLNELISFVFLKNQRIYKPAVVKQWVEEVLGQFRETGLLQDDVWGNVELHAVLHRGPFDQNEDGDGDENFVVHPDHNHHHRHAEGSSQETLSNVPHYQRVWRRKGTPTALPKHRTHAVSLTPPQEETDRGSTSAPHGENANPTEPISEANLNVIVDPNFGREMINSLDELITRTFEEENEMSPNVCS